MLSSDPTNVTLGEIGQMVLSDKDGNETTYAVLFCKACVDSICRAYKRNEPMDHEERMRTAEMMADNYPFLSITDMWDFENKLTTGRIVTGNNEYEMRAVDRGSIMAKLKAYNSQFAHKTYSSTEQVQTMQVTPAAVPLGARDGWERRHDVFGNEQPKGWDYNAYWQNWRLTHNWDVVTHRWVTAPERTLEEAVDFYQNRQVTQEEIDGICSRANGCVKSV